MKEKESPRLAGLLALVALIGMAVIGPAILYLCFVIADYARQYNF